MPGRLGEARIERERVRCHGMKPDKSDVPSRCNGTALIRLGLCVNVSVTKPLWSRKTRDNVVHCGKFKGEVEKFIV